LYIFNSPAGVEITFQVMAVALQSTGHYYAICTILKGSQDVEHIQLP
jgi:hypothetical protein